MAEEVNEGCGCNETAKNIRSTTTGNPKYPQDPLVGKNVSLVDGRSGKVDDSIRNQTGEVIGYVIEGEKGNYRVFKNKIKNELDESGGPLASLPGIPGMGNVKPPTENQKGSGDQFPTLTVGTPAAKKDKKKEVEKDPHKLDLSVMNYDNFLKSMKKNQQKDQKNKPKEK